MNKCTFKCDPKYIGKWHDLIIKNLETQNFNIDKSNYYVTIFSGKINLLDIRMKNTRYINPFTDYEMIQNRLEAEKILHKLYLKSSTECRKFKCSKTPITSLYISMEYINNNWKIICDSQEEAVGLCKKTYY